MAKKKSLKSRPSPGDRPESAPDLAFRVLAKEFGKIDAGKIEFFLTWKKYKTEIDLKIESFYHRYELSAGRFQILLLLRCSPDFSLSASALADKAGVSRASMTQFLDALERAGYVVRQPFPGDRRAILIKITPKGMRILDKKLLPSYFARSARFSSRCTAAEMKGFTEMYEKIWENLEDMELETD
jgi:DNA-binding MarR family transcriptional regulator